MAILGKSYGILTNPAYAEGADDAAMQEAPVQAPAPEQPQEAAPLPTIRTSANFAHPSPIFQPNPIRQQRERGLQQSILRQENRPAPTGFWGKAGHILSSIGNAAGNVILGANNMSMIPGTQLHDAAQHNAAEGELAGLEKQDATDQQLAGQEQLRGAQTHEAEARANSLENPPDKPDKFTYQQTDHGLMRIDSVTGEATPVTFNGQVLQAKPPAEKEVNAKEQLQRQLVEAENAGDTATVKKLQRQLTDIDPMGQQRLNLTIRGQDIAGGVRDQKADTVTRQAAYKAFQPSLDSGERFNVMAKNYEDAIRTHDQQAMLSLLANHLGMTMGLQKGSRLTRDIIREAQESRPWLQGMAAKFDKDGILSGITLTPEQMRQMVDLGRGRFNEDTVKARSESRYLGAQDDGPDRIPSKSTINFYLKQTNGDPARAKQLAAEDGWTVK